MADNNGSSEMSDAQCEEMLARYGERYRFVETGVHGVGNSRAQRRHPAVRAVSIQPKAKRKKRR